MGNIFEDFGNWLIDDVFDIDMPKQTSPYAAGRDVPAHSTESYLPIHYGKVLDIKVQSVPFLGVSNGTDSDDTENDLLHKIALFGKSVRTIDAIRIESVDSTSTQWQGEGDGKWLYAVDFPSGMNGYGDVHLIEGGYKSTYKYTDCACVYIRAEWGSEVVTSEPSDIRVDVTGELPSYAFPSVSLSTEQRLTNGVLHFYDYLVNHPNGPKWNVSLIHNDSWEAAIEKCIEQIETSLGSGTYRDYLSFNGTIDTSKQVHEIIKVFREALNAHMPYIDGQYHLYIESDDNYSEIEIDDDDIVGGLRTNESADVGDKVNQVVIKYPDQAQNGKMTEAIYPEPDSTLDLQYLAEDNQQRKSITIDSLFCNNRSEALQQAKMKLEISREGLKAAFKVKPRCRKIRCGQVVNVTNIRRGWDKKPFRVLGKTLYRDLYSDLKLREHQPYIYDPHGVNNLPSYPDTNFTTLVLTSPSNLQILDSDYGGKKATWSSSYSKFDYQVEDENETVIDEDYNLTGSNFELQNLADGNTYTFAVRARNNIGQTSKWVSETFVYQASAIEGEEPSTSLLPTIKAPSVSDTSTQDLYVWKVYYSVVDHGDIPDTDLSDFGGIVPYVTGQVFQIPEVLPNTTYYLWFGLIKKSQSSEQPTQWIKQTHTTGGGIGIEHLSQQTRDTLDQFSQDIESNSTANEALANGLQVVENIAKQSSTNLDSAINTWATSLLNDVDFDEALLGAYGQITQLQQVVTAQQTAISQSASKIELTALKSTINSLQLGDNSEAINIALGDTVARLEQVELFIEPDAFRVNLTSILSDEGYATATFVEQKISDLGIQNYVTQLDYNDAITQINSIIENLTPEFYGRTLVSFAKASKDIDKTNRNLLDVGLSNIVNEIEKGDFKGSLALQEKQIQTLTEEKLAEVESTEKQLTAVGERISVTNRALTNVVNEQQVTAKSIKELQAKDDEVLAQAQEFTRTTIGVCVDENGKITSHTDATSCQLVEGNQWVTNMALAEQINKVFIEVQDEDGNDVSISAGSLFQVLKSENNELKARAFFGLELPNGQQSGISVVTDDNGKITAVNFHGTSYNFYNKQGQPTLTLDPQTDTISIPGGTLTLTNQQKLELKGDQGEQGIQGSTGEQGIQGEQGADGQDGSNGAGIYTYTSTEFGLSAANGGGIADPVNGWPSESAVNARFKVSSGRDPVEGDHFTIRNPRQTNPFAITKQYKPSAPFNGSNWVAPTLQVDGDLLVEGSITAEKLKSNEILTNRIYAQNIEGDVVDIIVATFDDKTVSSTHNLSAVQGLFEIYVGAEENFARVLTISQFEIDPASSNSASGYAAGYIGIWETGGNDIPVNVEPLSKVRWYVDGQNERDFSLTDILSLSIPPSSGNRVYAVGIYMTENSFSNKAVIDDANQIIQIFKSGTSLGSFPL